MPEKVYLLGTPAPAPELVALREQLAAQQALPLEFLPLQPADRKLADVLRELAKEPDFLGAEVLAPHGTEAARACDGLSHLAQHAAAVSALVRRGEAEFRLVGRNLIAKAFRSALEGAGIANVRTTLIMGTGAAARSTMAALHEMGCNRFLVGFRTQKRAAEVSHLYRHWKRQLHFFPLDEMLDFFTWSAAAGCFESETSGSRATDHEHKLRAEREERQDPRRWELVVNATPVGNPGIEPDNLLPELHFMGCVGRVLDFSGGSSSTPLLELASRSGLPVIGAPAVAQRLASHSMELWASELRLRNGEEEDPTDYETTQQAQPKRFILKRR